MIIHVLCFFMCFMVICLYCFLTYRMDIITRREEHARDKERRKCVNGEIL